jgi:hypothetical protein
MRGLQPPEPIRIQPRNLNTTLFFDLERFEHTSARKLRGYFQTMRLRLLWTQRWPADCRGAGLSGRFKNFSRRCRSRSFSADYRRKKYGSQYDSRPRPQRETVHIDKPRPRNHSHLSVIFRKSLPITRCPDTLGCSPCLRASVVSFAFPIRARGRNY